MEDDREDLARFSHLLSSPLTALRGAIDLLRRPRRMPADPLARELIESLERNCARLLEVVQTLLAHSQVADGQVRIAAPLDVFKSVPDRPATIAPDTAPALAADIALAPAARPAPSVAEGSPPDTTPMTVLLVEDSATYRGVMRMLLQGAGYIVLEATNG